MPDGEDLRVMSVAELRALRRRVDRAIEAAVAARRKRAARPDVLASFGLRPEDLGPLRASPVVGKALPPKYRDPANEGNTWSGRGSKPRWFREALAAGTPLEALEVRHGQSRGSAGDGAYPGIRHSPEKRPAGPALGPGPRSRP